MGFDLRKHDSISRVNAKQSTHLVPFNQLDGSLISCNDNPIYIIGVGNLPSSPQPNYRETWGGFGGDWGDDSYTFSSPILIGTDKPNDGDVMTFIAWMRPNDLYVGIHNATFGIRRVNGNIDYYSLSLGGLIVGSVVRTVGITMVYSEITDQWHVTSNTSLT